MSMFLMKTCMLLPIFLLANLRYPSAVAARVDDGDPCIAEGKCVRFAGIEFDIRDSRFSNLTNHSTLAPQVLDAKSCLEEACDNEVESEHSFCELHIAQSLIPNAGMGVFTSVDIPKGTIIGNADMYIPLADRFKTIPYRGQHRWLSWLNYIRGTTNFLIPQNKALATIHPNRLRRSATGPQFVDDQYRLDAFAPGLASMAVPHPKKANMVLGSNLPKPDNMGLHRSKDAAIGSFTSYHGAVFIADKDIAAGSELYIEPTDEQLETEKFPMPESLATPNWLRKNGVCIDNLSVGPSTIKNAGRGAFAKRRIPNGAVIAPSSLAVIKRDDLVLFDADEHATHYEKVLNKEKVIGHELLLNYCFGHPESHLLLLPLSPMVNYINHHNTKANAEIRWPNDPKMKEKWMNSHPLEMIDMSGTPMFEIVAIKEIQRDDEIFLNYGEGWDSSWQKHIETWAPKPEYEDYMSAQEYLESDKFSIRTTEEQKEHPYPENVQTVCFIRKKAYRKMCRIPCEILERTTRNGATAYSISYNAKVHGSQAKRMIAWDFCGKERDEINATIPAGQITLIDKWTSKDHFLSGTFRREIGVPEHFFPPLWMEPAVYEVSPVPLLEPGEHRAITWKHNSKPVTRNALYVGLPPNFNEFMFDFAERMGVMEIFRNVLNGRPNEIGTHRYVDLKEGQYYVQRPHWNSNMHWVIPND